MTARVHTLAIGPGGVVRALFDGPIDLRRLGCLPQRASRVEAIDDPGPSRGLFFADMSLLGDDHQVCLWPPQEAYKAAVAAEIAYIKQRWIEGGPPCPC